MSPYKEPLTPNPQPQPLDLTPTAGEPPQPASRRNTTNEIQSIAKDQTETTYEMVTLNTDGTISSYSHTVRIVERTQTTTYNFTNCPTHTSHTNH